MFTCACKSTGCGYATSQLTRKRTWKVLNRFVQSHRTERTTGTGTSSPTTPAVMAPSPLVRPPPNTSINRHEMKNFYSAQAPPGYRQKATYSLLNHFGATATQCMPFHRQHFMKSLATSIGFPLSQLHTGKCSTPLYTSLPLLAVEQTSDGDRPDSYAEYFRRQFDSLSGEELNRIVSCYGELLPYPEQADILCTTLDDHLVDLVFSDLDLCTKLFLLDSSLEHVEQDQVKDTKDTLQTDKDPQDPSARQTMFNCPFLWTYNSTVRQMHHNFGCQAMLHGQPLVIDCGYEQTMQRRELPSYVSQVQSIIRNNLRNWDPFHLHFCNVPSETHLNTEETGPNIYNMPVTSTEKCFTELFDAGDLIMLSPDAPLYMEDYEPDKIYIIGGIVDLGATQPLTYYKSQALGIESRKLPLEIYMDWGHGSGKKLTLTAVTEILHKLKSGRGWHDALHDSIPSRFLSRNGVINELSVQRREKMLEDVRRRSASHEEKLRKQRARRDKRQEGTTPDPRRGKMPDKSLISQMKNKRRNL